MLTVPNVITIVRLLMLPLIVYFVLVGRYGAAFYLFLAAALGDLLDGFIARRFNQISALGAILDPIADKITMLTMTVLLAWHEILPLWLAVAILVRDIVIAGGALAYHFVVGRVEMAPTMISKLNTSLVFGTLCAALAATAAIVPGGPWMRSLYILVFVTVIASGLHYVWVWGGKAVRAVRRAR